MSTGATEVAARSGGGSPSAGSASSALVDDVLAGLRSRPKRLQPLYFYDTLGSWLFERICDQPEYTLTRTELRILEESASAIGAAIGPNARIVELGVGSAHKSRVLLGGLARPAIYIPIDISRSALLEAANEIAAARPDLEVLPLCADFTQPLRLPRSERRFATTVVFFPGSTIGNFEEAAAITLLRQTRELLGGPASLVIGTDFVKEVGLLEAAYDDAAGVTREFNLNVLRRLNREFDADFRLQAFRHEALWDARAARIEMRLVSLIAQDVTVAGETFSFDQGEPLTTEYSHKYTTAGFARLAAAAGWRHEWTWTDPLEHFGVHLLR
jgi:dimethylhistidine N-methyltransferase